MYNFHTRSGSVKHKDKLQLKEDRGLFNAGVGRLSEDNDENLMAQVPEPIVKTIPKEQETQNSQSGKAPKLPPRKPPPVVERPAGGELKEINEKRNNSVHPSQRSTESEEAKSELSIQEQIDSIRRLNNNLKERPVSMDDEDDSELIFASKKVVRHLTKAYLVERNYTSDQEFKVHQFSMGQKFWKYHILSIGTDLFYLSSIPEINHLCCRYSPGFFVSISRFRDEDGLPAYRMSFKGEVDNFNDRLLLISELPVVAVITKRIKTGFDIQITKTYALKDHLISFMGEGKRINGGTEYLEIPELNNLDLEDADLKQTLSRYELHMEGASKESWIVSPILRKSRKISNKLGLSQSVYKIKGKRNIFFYKNSKKGDGTFSENSKDVVGLFRPSQTKLKKKIIKGASQLKHLERNSYISPQSLGIPDDPSTNSVQRYYRAADGYLEEFPKDDSPNQVKLGWITIYENSLFKRANGLWELCLTMTLTAGLDRIIAGT
ncbi:BA75_04738T0 [Komagataella pastoris]|uniref:BA75_04738T0 n=1 Tax=Komagataella pastoris TaxID=4922 RepID=A0A1B2JHL7_PICPA|nr:BA75_04738T0 [Komagataella pastoris]